MSGELPQVGAVIPQRAPFDAIDLAAMKLTRGTSCVLCQQRKVRCDKNKPCANCVKARVECRVIPPMPPRRRKKRLQEKDLVDRLKKYEALLTENGVKFEAIGPDLRVGGHDRDSIDEVAARRTAVVAGGQRDVQRLVEGVLAGLAGLPADQVDDLVLAVQDEVVQPQQQRRALLQGRPCPRLLGVARPREGLADVGLARLRDHRQRLPADR